MENTTRSGAEHVVVLASEAVASVWQAVLMAVHAVAAVAAVVGTAVHGLAHVAAGVAATVVGLVTASRLFTRELALLETCLTRTHTRTYRC